MQNATVFSSHETPFGEDNESVHDRKDANDTAANNLLEKKGGEKKIKKKKEK